MHIKIRKSSFFTRLKQLLKKSLTKERRAYHDSRMMSKATKQWIGNNGNVPQYKYCTKKMLKIVYCALASNVIFSIGTHYVIFVTNLNVQLTCNAIGNNYIYF